ncbi:hypothetical protein B296_00050978, partial [Ensete ventricosum]
MAQGSSPEEDRDSPEDCQGYPKGMPRVGKVLNLGIGPGSDDVVGPHREFARRFAEGVEKLAGNTLGDYRKKTKRLVVRMPEAPDWRDLDDVVGSHRKFVRRFAEGIGKLVGNVKGDRREEDRRTCRKITEGYRSMR